MSKKATTPNKPKRNSRQPKLNETELQLINCHSCRTISNANCMVTCSKLSCRESFCINCLNRGRHLDPSNFAILKQKERTWRCLKCKKKCHCFSCKEALDKKQKKQEKKKVSLLRRKKKRNSKTKKKTNPLIAQDRSNLPEDVTSEKDDTINGSKVNNIIKMDDFEIFECDFEGQSDSDKSKVEKEERANMSQFPKGSEITPQDNSSWQKETKIEPFDMIIKPKPKVYQINKERGQKKVMKIRCTKIERRPFRPCLICRNFKSNIRAIKFKTIIDLIQSLRDLIKILDDKYSQGELNDLTNDLETSERENFINNKNNFDIFIQDFYNGTQNLSNQLGTPKRFCEHCLMNKLKQPNGLKKILEIIKENDESITLDIRSKHNILRNMENLILNSYRGHWPNESFKSDMEQSEENRKTNIFNRIFNNIPRCSRKLKSFMDNINLNLNFAPNIVFNFNGNGNDSVYNLNLSNMSDEFKSLINVIKDQQKYFENIHRENELLANSLIQNALIYYNMNKELTEQMNNCIQEIGDVVKKIEGRAEIEKSSRELNNFQRIQSTFKDNFNIFINTVQSLAGFYQDLKSFSRLISNSLNK